jgi:hypothetical protein
MAELHETAPGGQARGDDPGEPLVIERAEQLWEPTSRRGFLRLLGSGGTVALMPSVFTACDSPRRITGPDPTAGPVLLNLGNDVGILNYAYALEQLEAGFYTAVVASSVFGGMTPEQQELFRDLRDHEVIHREFLRQVLGADRIGDLALNTGAVNTSLGSLASILRTTEAFEDLVVSVEARHAAAVRDLRESLGISAGTPAGTRFAGDDVVIPTGAAAGLDVKLEPGVVLQRVAGTGFVTNPVSISTQPPQRPGTADFGPPSPTP